MSLDGYINKLFVPDESIARRIREITNEQTHIYPQMDLTGSEWLRPYGIYNYNVLHELNAPTWRAARRALIGHNPTCEIHAIYQHRPRGEFCYTVNNFDGVIPCGIRIHNRSSGLPSCSLMYLREGEQTFVLRLQAAIRHRA